MVSSGVPAIVVDRVSKIYGTTRALDGISLTVPAGQFVAVIGRSGAGKTTLLRCLSRAVTPSAGAIAVAGDDIVGLRGRALRRHRARVGMIYQQFNLVRRLTVMDNVLIGRLPHASGAWRWAALIRRFAQRDRDIAARALDHVGLLDRAWQRVDTLSGGQQQRVAIARALAQAPEMILADEPVASLDLANGTAVMETLRGRAAAAGLTVIATLHHVEYARRFADRILALADGQLVFDGMPDALDDAMLLRVFGELSGPVDATEPITAGQPAWAAV
jgi:phosphonate transport system ATP-binding protein